MGFDRRPLIALVMLLMSACSPSTGSCTQTLDCRPGWNCVNDACRQVCNNTADCDEIGFRCEFGVCMPNNGNECETATDCKTPNACQLRTGARCEDGACLYVPVPCVDPPDDTCIDGGNTFRAHGQTGTCVLGTGGCEYPTFDTPCPSCETTCLTACAPLDCADWECVTAGRCAPDPPATCVHDVLADDAPCVQGTGLTGTCFDGACLAPGEVSCLSNPPCPDTCIGGWCRPRSSGGWPCDPGDDDDCLTDLTCVDSRCRAANGTSCTTNLACLETCIAGECAPLSGATGQCDANDDDDCASGLACASGFCFVAPGGDCNFNDDCAGTCIVQICSPVSAIGGPCDTGDDDDCTGVAACDGGTCRLPDGATCSTNDDCTNTCIDLTCAPRPAPEGRCDDPADCDSSAGNATCLGGFCRLLSGTCTGNDQCVETCIQGSCAAVSQLLGPCDDIDDCDGSLECATDQCRQPDATTCNSDAECASSHCECTTSSCSPRVCAPNDCTCGYGADGSCGTNLPNNSADPEDCDGSLRCQSGTCRSTSPGSCSCVCGSTEANCTPPHVNNNSCGTGWTATCSSTGCLWFCYSGCSCLTGDPAPTCSCN